MFSGNVIPFDLPGFVIEQIEADQDSLTICAQSTTRSAPCPDCGQVSQRVHSYYMRMPQDLPCSGRQVRLKLQVPRFRCLQGTCGRQTFVERLPEVVALHAQRTNRLTTSLRGLALALGGEAGARATQLDHMPVSGDTLLRIVRQTKLPEVTCPAVIGIDDWAFARGRRYGTLIVNLETHQPVDLLPDRTAQSVADWLKAHPGAMVVSRDRSKEYKAGISQGAPQAIQVADRWHLLKNLGDAVQRVLARHPQALRQAARAALDQGSENTNLPAAPPAPDPPVAPPQPVLTYRQQRFVEVKERVARGESDRAIARQMHLDRQTVARYRQLDELPRRTTPQNVSSVTPYLAYLHQRWAQAEHNVKQLWRELRAQGYTGSPMSVYRAIRHFPDQARHSTAGSPSPPAPPALSPRQAMWLLVNDPARLTPEQERQRQALCEQCDEAALVYPLAQRFVTLIKQQQVQQLDPWLKDALASPVAVIRRFAADLQQDYAAVRAALTFDWSNGQLEGQINRLKYLKRQMYGRAKFDLLRLRVLHPP
jgi:transposase